MTSVMFTEETVYSKCQHMVDEVIFKVKVTIQQLLDYKSKSCIQSLI